MNAFLQAVRKPLTAPSDAVVGFRWREWSAMAPAIRNRSFFQRHSDLSARSEQNAQHVAGLASGRHRGDRGRKHGRDRDSLQGDGTRQVSASAQQSFLIQEGLANALPTIRTPKSPMSFQTLAYN